MEQYKSKFNEGKKKFKVGGKLDFGKMRVGDKLVNDIGLTVGLCINFGMVYYNNGKVILEKGSPFNDKTEQITFTDEEINILNLVKKGLVD